MSFRRFRISHATPRDIHEQFRLLGHYGEPERVLAEAEHEYGRNYTFRRLGRQNLDEMYAAWAQAQQEKTDGGE